LGASNVTGNAMKSAIALVQPHDIKSGRSIPQIQLCVFRIKGFPIIGRKDNLTVGTKIFGRYPLSNEFFSHAIHQSDGSIALF
jgi:hypothetical protein